MLAQIIYSNYLHEIHFTHRTLDINTSSNQLM